MTPEQRREWRKTVFGFANPDLKHAHKVVLLALETFADYPEGTNARPGVDRLAEWCSVNESTVRRAIEAGQQLGLIEQTARANPKRNLAAVYRLLPQIVSTVHASTLDDISTVHASTLDTPIAPTFNRAQSAFLPGRNAVSTVHACTPTNTHQTNNHQGNRLRQSGTSLGPLDRPGEVATDPTAHQQPANGQAPPFIDGPFGRRCRRHAHLPKRPDDCNRCQEMAEAQEVAP